MKSKEFDEYLRDNSQIKVNNRVTEIQVDNYLPENKRLKNYRLPTIRIFSSLIILIALFTALYLNFNPTAKITLEFNPYIELEVNMFNRVINVTEINDSAEKMLDEINPKFQKFEKVISEIYQYGYDNDIVIGQNLYAIIDIETENEKQESNITEIIRDVPKLKPIITIKTNQINDFQESSEALFAGNESASSDSYDSDFTSYYEDVIGNQDMSVLHLNIVYQVFERNPEIQSQEYLNTLLSLTIEELYILYYAD